MATRLASPQWTQPFAQTSLIAASRGREGLELSGLLAPYVATLGRAGWLWLWLWV